MKRIDSSYKYIEVFSGRRGSADTVVNVATVEFRFGSVVLIKKLVFNVAYEKIGVAGSHFGTNGHAIDLFNNSNRISELNFVYNKDFFSPMWGISFIKGLSFIFTYSNCVTYFEFRRFIRVWGFILPYKL